MYPDWMNEILRSPASGAKLKPLAECFEADGERFPLIEGILSAVYPALSGQDAQWNKMYNLMAPFYDFSENIGGRLLAGVNMEAGRRDIVSLLSLQTGMRLLEVSPGPGVFQRYLRSAVGSQGEIASLDLSMNMLMQCKKKNKDLNIHLIQGNAQYLPFAENSFDGLFHFGGVNLFNDPQKALAEFVRVVKPGGLVSWGDEGISDKYPHNWRRRVLTKINPGNLKPRPEIPVGLIDVHEHEVYGGLGYLVTGKKQYT